MSTPRHVPSLLKDRAEERHRDSHHRKPRSQEKKVAAAIGGSRRPGSGAFAGLKGDVQRAHKGFPLLVECKRSMGNRSIRLEASHLTKISAEALGSGAYPALALQFDTEVMAQVARADERAPASADWVAVPLHVFQAMLEALGDEGLDL